MLRLQYVANHMTREAPHPVRNREPFRFGLGPQNVGHLIVDHFNPMRRGFHDAILAIDIAHKKHVISLADHTLGRSSYLAATNSRAASSTGISSYNVQLI
jgi:hypothetical protein